MHVTEILFAGKLTFYFCSPLFKYHQILHKATVSKQDVTAEYYAILAFFALKKKFPHQAYTV